MEPLWAEQVTLLTTQITTLEHRIDTCVQQDATVQHRFEQVTAIPGVGQCFGAPWVSLFAGHRRLQPRQIASRFGFAPHGRESGTSQQRPATSTGHGDTLVRKLATLAARSAQQHWPKMREYKAKKLAEGKPARLITNLP